MAGVLNFPTMPIVRSISPQKTLNHRRGISVRVSSESSEPSTSVSTKEVPKLGFPSSSSSSSSSSTATTPVFSPPSDFVAPNPKRFTVRPDKLIDILGASLALFFRFATGVFVSGYSASLVPQSEIPPGTYALEVADAIHNFEVIETKLCAPHSSKSDNWNLCDSINCYKVKETSKLGPRPEKPIEIYEFESCPFCRKVREIVSVLDLDVIFYPCPKKGPNFRPKVAQMGGKQQFPYMVHKSVDPNTGVAMYESDEIIKYLVGKYGDGNVPLMLSLGLFTTLTEGFAMIGRMGRGSSYTPSRLPPEPLKIWSYEGSPFCKVVREVLVELELPHLLINCARGSPKRQMLYEKVGHFQVPYLEDPNTGVQMFESAEIVEYLRATYALK
ncbi:Glutathione S-transferase, N-terminal [Dillenia turbinata]|uniref:Glutathione S-transferase, N-terminal n=1 Tax=Dillenia turbinata TaxID=194707 RepID=A0AAN8ZQY7_9MAGN